MNLSIDIANNNNLTVDEISKFNKLVDIYNNHNGANYTKNRYYEGHITLNEVNLGIALPEGLRGLEIGCEWGAKAVDVLASRSMFDGFVGASGAEPELITRIANYNCLVSEYTKACKDELKYGCTFATLSADSYGKCRIRFHSPQSAAAIWDGAKDRIECGFAIVDVEKVGDLDQPTLINYYTDTDIIVLSFDKSQWFATRYPHKMGRPLMEGMIWNATTEKPFGKSRIKEPVRRLIQGYVRTIANATIALEFSTAPQKYLLGVTDEQYDILINQKFKQYVGSIITSTTNPETGEKPTFGQLTQGTISPHVEMVRMLATQFSAATGLSVTDTGVVNEANPTSADAVLAQTQTLVLMAEQLNAGNANALYTIALMAQAIEKNTTIDGLTDDEKNIVAHFKNPAMPSVAATADAAIKIASARPSFAGTKVFLEMIGFDQADIRRIESQEVLQRGLSVLEEINGRNNANAVEGVYNNTGEIE